MIGLDLIAFLAIFLGVVGSVVAISVHVQLARIKHRVQKELLEKPVEKISELQERAKELLRQSL